MKGKGEDEDDNNALDTAVFCLIEQTFRIQMFHNVYG